MEIEFNVLQTQLRIERWIKFIFVLTPCLNEYCLKIWHITRQAMSIFNWFRPILGFTSFVNFSMNNLSAYQRARCKTCHSCPSRMHSLYDHFYLVVQTWPCLKEQNWYMCVSGLLYSRLNCHSCPMMHHTNYLIRSILCLFKLSLVWNKLNDINTAVQIVIF